MDSEQGKRADRAKFLHDNYKKEPRPDRTKAKEWEEKRMKKQVHIHQPNLNAGTVINEINGGTFESVNNEVKFMSKKSDDDDDFQPAPVRQQKRKKNLSLPKAETTKNTPSSLPKAVLELSPGSGNFILNDQRPQTSDPSDLYIEVEENAGDQFVERIEDHKPTSKTCRSWILRSGTNVGETLARYVETIPEAQKCLNLAYWNILDLTEDGLIRSFFSKNDWQEITESFEKEVTLIESDIPDVVTYFFNEVEKITKQENENIKDIVDNIRRAIITYTENLKGLELPISESDFDNDFPNMLTKRFLEKRDLKMDVGEIACWASSRRRNEGRSIVLRARIGQKCDFRGTLKNSVNSLEAIIGLRSGGLPIAHRKKIFEDRIDLSVAMRDVLYDFFKSNSHAPGDDLHRTYVLGIQSWGWVHETYGMDCKATNVLRLGRLSQTRLPNTQKSLAILEGFYAIMSDVKATLKAICDHTNNVSLSNSRAHRDRKRKNSAHDKQLGSFGIPSASPKKKNKLQIA
ncbi:unnamed protein product [Rhizophagus irregularis]|nr:unnamed protein product [Rhizophagus irregularis]